MRKSTLPTQRNHRSNELHSASNRKSEPSQDVQERDFTIELSTTEFAPGAYTFVVTNSGQTTHALAIEGQGIEEETENIAPGDSASLAVTLESGEYQLYCPVGNHRDTGMELDIAVD